MNPKFYRWVLLTLAAALLFSCQAITNIPFNSNSNAPTISLYEILRQYAQNQGWPEPGSDTCQDLGSIQPPGTTCFQPIELPYMDGGGLVISHFEQHGTSGHYCFVGSTASIYTFRNTDPISDSSPSEYSTETYHNVAVAHYTYQTPTYTKLIYRWYYENLTFTIDETSYGIDCQAYYPNTQAFQFLIDLMEQGYVVE